MLLPPSLSKNKCVPCSEHVVTVHSQHKASQWTAKETARKNKLSIEYLSFPRAPKPTPSDSLGCEAWPISVEGKQNDQGWLGLLRYTKGKKKSWWLFLTQSFCHSRRWQFHLFASWRKPERESCPTAEPRDLLTELCPLHDFLVPHVWCARWHPEDQTAVPKARWIWPGAVDPERAPGELLEGRTCSSSQVCETLSGELDCSLLN